MALTINLDISFGVKSFVKRLITTLRGIF